MHATVAMIYKGESERAAHQRRKTCTNSHQRLKLLLEQSANGLALMERGVIAINDSPVQS